MLKVRGHIFMTSKKSDKFCDPPTAQPHPPPPFPVDVINVWPPTILGRGRKMFKSSYLRIINRWGMFRNMGSLGANAISTCAGC